MKDLNRIDLNLLVYLDVLLRERNVTQAANHLGLSQPAMSHHLKKLRDAELVETRRDGQTIYYSVKGIEVMEVITVLHRLYCPQV